MSENGTDSTPLPLSGKINRLFATFHGRGEPEKTEPAVAAALTATLHRTIEPAYLAQLRAGSEDTRPESVPRDLLDALARHFGVAVEYLHDHTEMARQIDQELDLLAALREASVTAVELRGEAPEDRRVLSRIIGAAADDTSS